MPHFGSREELRGVSLGRHESSDGFSFAGDEESEAGEWEDLLCRAPRPEAPSQGESDSEEEASGVTLPPVPRTPQDRLQIC